MLTSWEEFNVLAGTRLSAEEIDNPHSPTKYSYSKVATIAFVLQSLGVFSNPNVISRNKLLLIVLGGTKAEEENAISTWGILPKLLLLENASFTIEIIMIGPDVTSERHNTTIALGTQCTLSLYSMPFHKWRDDLVDIKQYVDPDMFFAFHSGVHYYLNSWTPSLVGILNDRVPICLTSYDHNDEERQWTVLSRAKPEILIDRIDNPFACWRPRIDADTATTSEPETTTEITPGEVPMKLCNSRLMVLRGAEGVVYAVGSRGPQIFLKMK